MFPRSLAPPLAPIVLSALLAGCGDGRRPVLEWADYVEHQRGHVATDLIRAADGRGLERLRSGWLVAAPEGGEPHLEIGARHASVGFYSYDGGTAEVEIEATLARDGKGRERLSLRLNDRPLPTRNTLEPGRRSYRFALPAGVVRAGENVLDVDLRPGRARAGRNRPSRVQIHGLRFHGGDSRPPRRSRPGRVELIETEGRRGLRRTVEVPSPGRLDLVAELPAGARLGGRLGVEPEGGPQAAPLEVRIELVDARGAEHELYRRAGAEAFDDRIDLDLAPWAGELAWLRLSFAGSRNGVLRLHDVGVEAPPDAAQTVERPLPVLLQPAGSSARLAGSDVVVVLLDAARADAFPPHESDEVTPTAARLAAAGTRFDAAVAPSSWTGQSVPAIFTGLYPDSIGMETWGSRLPEAVPTLAQLFQRAGYRTVLWTQHPFYRSQPELTRGFDEVHYGRKGDFSHLPASSELLGEGDRPLFAFVHLLPPHAPYEPPPPFRGLFTASYEGSVELGPRFLNDFPKRRDPSELSAHDLAYIRGRYRENVAWADALAGGVVGLLEAAGRYEEALVALISDHGEAFLEHGRFLHGLYVHAEFVRVPAVLKWPASASGFAPVLARPVSLVDLAPTLADAFALDPEARFQGRSLLPELFGGSAPPPPPPVYATTRGIADGRRPPQPRHRLEEGAWKIVVDLADQRHYLYRAEDALDAEDLAAEEPLRALLLRQRALLQAAHNRKIREGLGALETNELDPETVERLKALGYL